MTITEFLLARIAEDEAIGRDWQHHRGKVEIHGGGTGYLRLASPEHVLAECEAKRRIVAEHAPVDNQPDSWCTTCDGDGWPCATMTALASVYADHPYFRAEWLLTA